MIFTFLTTFINKKFSPFYFNKSIYRNYWYNFKILNISNASEKRYLFFNYIDLFKSSFLILSWLKARVLYYVSNWIYTTNHKRIAINYFWFVILAGMIGMALATVIRLELAYPGVGIFAGDSLQYLSLVTAHGVIMVFFMIMPLLLGAFANFLLPTQLGVHDVAFPRLNSAAFWFLPGSLLMLAQLVCVDRRYQRMNCFNIREIQSLLKRRFFNDLINSRDHRDLLNQTAVGLRFKTNNIATVRSNIFLFYNYGTNSNSNYRSAKTVSVTIDETSYLNLNSFFFLIVKTLDKSLPFFLFNNLYYFIFQKIFSPTARLFNCFNFFFTDSSSIFASIANLISNLINLLTISLLKFLEIKHFFSSHASKLISIVSAIVYDAIAYHADFIKKHGWILWFFNVKLIDKHVNDAIKCVFDTIKYLYKIGEYAVSRCSGKLLDLKSNTWQAWHILFVKKTSGTVAHFIELTSSGRDRLFFSLSTYDWKNVVKTFEIKIDKNSIQTRFFRLCNFFTNKSVKKEPTLHFCFFDLIVLKNQTQIFLVFQFKTLCDLFERIPSFRLRSPSLPPFQFYVHLHRDIYLFLVINLNLFSFLRDSLIAYLVSRELIKKNEVRPSDFKNIKFIFEQPDTLFSNYLPSATLNYDSFFAYCQVAFYTLHYLFWFFFYFITNGPDFKELSKFVNNLNNMLILWYIPLFFSEWTLFFFVKNRIQTRHPSLFDSNWIRSFNSFLYNKIHRDSPLLSYYVNKEAATDVLSDYASVFQTFYIGPVVWFWNLINNLIFNWERPRFCRLVHELILWNFNFKNISWTSKYLNYKSDYFANIDLKNRIKFDKEEFSANSRFHRFDNPLFKYDYKSGDYFPKLYKEVYSYLFPTIANLTGGLRASPWFFSNTYAEIFANDFFSYFNNVIKLFNAEKMSSHYWVTSRFKNTNAFYNFFFVLAADTEFATKRWISLNILNQKFYKMFNSSSMQQRIYTNWRQLKFTREAWRCKLLSARHQKTLYRRYISEDGVFWSIERNAKDLLPGWAMITPFSSRTRFTAIGKVDIGLMGILLVLNASIISSANFLVTYRYLSTLNNRKMRDARSFYTEGIIVVSWMIIAANPMLVIGIVMLLSDRHWQTSFFDYSGGGDTVLFQHMFWFFGHPEVYIIMIPVFGFTNTILSYYLRKRISARASLLYSMYTIAFLGFFVWGHHMYMVGLSHTTRMLFSTLTVMISVPAATKLMHWCVTLANSAISIELPMLCILTFIFFFVSGGVSGMFVAHTGMDVLFHDTFYVIAHFHVMLAGAAMIGSFGAFYFYFVAIFGVKYSRIYAYLHYIYYLLGQLFTLVPMFWLGYAGMPRRVLDYPASLGGWHSFVSGGHMLNVAGLLAFFIMIFDSLRQAKAVVRNTFGISRYNTRLNFYIYETSRLLFVQQKCWSFFRLVQPTFLKLNGLNYMNYEHLETTLYTYSFAKK